MGRSGKGGGGQRVLGCREQHSYLLNLFSFYLVVNCNSAGAGEILPDDIDVGALISLEGAEPFQPELDLVASVDAISSATKKSGQRLSQCHWSDSRRGHEEPM